MRRIIRLAVLFGILMVSSCAHVRQTCDSYCLSNGGTCESIDHGTRRYNTESGAYDQRPTYFNCKYFN